MRKLRLFFHTVRYLKPVQVYGRIWFKLYKPKPDPAPPAQAAPRSGTWIQPALRPQSLTGQRIFSHLNETHNLPSTGPWHIAEVSYLWNYHLHYFDDLVSEGFEERRQWHAELITNWIGGNPPGSSPGWDPYPISRRVVNWIKAELAGPILDQAAVESLAAQTRHLIKKPEYHLQGNHLWANAKAMIFAGLFFGGHKTKGEAKNWLAKGLRLAGRQLREQVRPDGSHCEQSPMYHALMLEDVLDIINLGRTFGWEEAEQWTTVAKRMLGYLRRVCHPDGQLVLFNDAAMNMTPAPEQLLQYGRNLGISPGAICPGSSECEHSPDSGLVRVDKGAWSLFFDTGPIGPDYIPGHAHADNLTFELSLDGKRIIVDTGTGLYGTGDLRQYQRSTAAHNTVRVDRIDSSEVWAGFRVARRAKPLEPAKINVSDGQIVCQAGHDGYARLAGGVIHERKIRINAQEVFIQDDLIGHKEHEVEVFLHFHPDFHLEENEAGWLVVEHATGIARAKISFRGGDTSGKEKYAYSPEFGLFLQAERLTARKLGRLPCSLQTAIVLQSSDSAFLH